MSVATVPVSRPRCQQFTAAFDSDRLWCVIDQDGNVIMEGLPSEPDQHEINNYARAFGDYDAQLKQLE